MIPADELTVFIGWSTPTLFYRPDGFFPEDSRLWVAEASRFRDGFRRFRLATCGEAASCPDTFRLTFACLPRARTVLGAAVARVLLGLFGGVFSVGSARKAQVQELGQS